MSFPEDNVPHKPPLDLNEAFSDFYQDFKEKYNNHQLLSFQDENEDPSFPVNRPNPIFSQSEQEHVNSTAFLFNGFESIVRQPSRQLNNSNFRLDCSPEIKLGVKGVSRFYSFEPDDDGLYSYWGGKSNVNMMNIQETNGHTTEQHNIAEKEETKHETSDHIEEIDEREEEKEHYEDKEQNEEMGMMEAGQRDNMMDNGGGRSSRGLRVLSLKVKEIVCEKKETSYKEVAESLVQGLNLKEIEMGKDEQNVKRRVYDALNVLIAADVLKKKGKKVVSDYYSTLMGKSLKFQTKFEKNLNEESKKKVQEIIRIKTEKLKDILNKTTGLQYLINRNKVAKNNEIKEVLHFPFIAIENQSDEQVKCVSTKNKQDFAIFFKNGFGIYGDMDILLKLEFHQKGQNFARDAIEASGAQKIL